MNSLLGIGRKNRLKISRMIYPDYDAISDLMNENEEILGIDRFSLSEGSVSGTGKFTGLTPQAQSSAVREDDAAKDDSDLFEPVGHTNMRSEVDYSAAPKAVMNMAAATNTSDTVVQEPCGSGMLGLEEEQCQVSGEEGDFFPDLGEKAVSEPVISFPIEDEVVDMMVLTVSGIDFDAIEFGDAEQEDIALGSDIAADEECGLFCACDGTVIDITEHAEPETVQDVCMLSAPAEMSALAAPAPVTAISAPAEIQVIEAAECSAAIEAPAEMQAVEAPEQLPAIQAPAMSQEDIEMQEALIAAGVEVFVTETVERLAAEEAENQARLEAAIRDAALAAQAVSELVQRTVSRIAAEEAENQARLEAAIEQAALTAAAVRVFVQETVDRIAAEEAERQSKLEAAVREAAFVAQAVSGMVQRTVDAIAVEESVYIPAAEQNIEAVQEEEVYAEAFAVSENSEDVCAEAVPCMQSAAEAEQMPAGRTSVSFGFFGMPVSPITRASTVNFRFGRA